MKIGRKRYHRSSCAEHGSAERANGTDSLVSRKKKKCDIGCMWIFQALIQPSFGKVIKPKPNAPSSKGVNAYSGTTNVSATLSG